MERIFHIKARSKEEAENQIRQLLLSDFIKTGFLKIMDQLNIPVHAEILQKIEEDISIICDEFEEDYQELLSQFLKEHEGK